MGINECFACCADRYCSFGFIVFLQISYSFLLTNLLVIPLVSGIMYATVALLVFTPFPMLYTGFSVVVRSLVDWLNTMVRWVEHLPLASIDRVWIYPTEAFAFYLVLLIGMRYKVVRSLKCLYVWVFVSWLWEVFIGWAE